MEKVSELGEQICTYLKDFNRVVVDLLQNGIPEDQLKEKTQWMTHSLPKELLCLYKWRNGIEALEGTVLDKLHFIPGFYFLSVEEATQVYELHNKTKRWNPRWFSIFANGGGDYYVVECRNRDKSPVISTTIDDEPKVVYASIRAMLQTFAECYRERAYYVDDDGCLEIVDELEAEISRKHNSGVQYWMDYE